MITAEEYAKIWLLAQDLAKREVEIMKFNSKEDGNKKGFIIERISYHIDRMTLGEKYLEPTIPQEEYND